jgi:hypothetical protein
MRIRSRCWFRCLPFPKTVYLGCVLSVVNRRPLPTNWGNVIATVITYTNNDESEENIGFLRFCLPLKQPIRVSRQQRIVYEKTRRGEVVAESVHGVRTA